MEHEVMETRLSDAVDAELDQLLTMWRNEQQLSPATVETIRQTILETPVELTPTWWTSYINYLNKVINQASRHQYPFALKKLHSSSYSAESSRQRKVQLHITPDWQPYLKLT